VELRKCIDELTSVFSSASVSAQKEHTRGEGDEKIIIRRVKTTLRRQVWTGTSRAAARAAVKYLELG